MYSNKDFKKKYLKYKMKYLKLKNTYLNIEMKGGDKPFLTNDNINLFDPTIKSQELMEPYLNPVYGLYICESGFITNCFYLYKAFPSTKLEYAKNANKIIKLSRSLNDSIQPTLEFENINPIDIGRYIALLYICKNNNNFIHMNTSRAVLTVGPTFNPKDKDNKRVLDDYIHTLKSYIDKVSLIKTHFPITDNDCKNMTDIDFHIILYCLWWISKNDKGIINYYKGINEVITICNDILSWGKHPVKYEPIDLKYTNPKSDSFEKLVLDITKKSFHKYEMQYPQHFCPTEKTQTYPDCGEITARNLINLICFEPETSLFNIKILNKYGAIDKLIEYYQVFNTFEKQSTEETVKIYNEDLNAKDAWSRLIIFYANNNLRFNHICSGSHNYELLDGMAADGTTPNFFQLIKNLLPAITKWDDLNTETDQNKIVSDDTDENGFGKIVIETRDYSTITIYCDVGHYYMHIDKKAIDYDVSKLKVSHALKINILLNDDIVIDDILNFLWINWSSELLVTKINDLSTDIKLRKKLLELSFTDKIKSDTRRQIKIDVQDADFFTYFVDIFGTNDKINEYAYISNNFEFVKRLPMLRHLNCNIHYDESTSTYIDLTPLLNITSIGDDFLSHWVKLENIDLKPLSKVTSIGNNFLFSCVKLENIDLSSLSNVTSIGNYFLYNCSGLQNINVPSVSKVTTIGDRFMSDCIQLKNINLIPLSNVTSIGDSFLFMCKELENIDLTSLSNVTSIGRNFLSECTKLENIKVPSVSNVTSIGSYFLSYCTKLKTIDLSFLSNVKVISYHFLSSTGLENINLSPLSKVTLIGDHFLSRCEELKEINLEPLSEVTIISANFMHRCTKLNTINLSYLSNVTSIGRGFLSMCIGLKSITFPSVSNITSIGDYFLYMCIELENIDLTSLSEVTIISDNFLYGCEKLKEINLTPLLNVTSIGNSFLSYCKNLKKIKLTIPLQLTWVGDNFLHPCISLEYINDKLILKGEPLNKYIFEKVKSIQPIL